MKDELDSDDLWVDWLYGELDAESEKRFEEHLATSEEARAHAAALTATREAFRELAPAEAPAAMKSALLAAARAEVAGRPAAVAPAKGLSRWAGFLESLAAHPALAAAATFALVAGVAGTLFVRGGGRHEIAHPAAPPRARSAETQAVGAPGAPPRAPGAAAAASSAESEEMGQPFSEPPAAESEPQGKRGRESAATAGAPASARRERAKAVSSGNLGRAGDSLEETTRVEKPRREAPARAASPAASAAASGAAITSRSARGNAPAPRLGAAGASAASEPPPVERRAAAVSDEAADEDRATGDQETAGDAREQRLRQALDRGDCPAAARLANDLRDDVPARYERAFAAAVSESRCHSQVERERRRRLSERPDGAR